MFTVATVTVFTADLLTATVRVIQDMVTVPFTGPIWVMLATFPLLECLALRLRQERRRQNERDSWTNLLNRDIFLVLSSN